MIKISENDILWTLYQKAFKIEGEDVRAPKNLCSYFWTSMWGGFLSFWVETPLWFLWILAVCCVGTSIFAISLNSTSLLFTVSLMTSLIGAMGVCAITLYKLITWLGKWMIPDWLVNIFLGTVVIGGGIALISSIVASLYPQMPHTGILGYGEATGACLGVIVGTICATAAVIGLMFLLIQFIFKPVIGWRFLQQCWAMLKAWKGKMCPLVEAPDTFLAEIAAKAEGSPQQSLGPGTS